ncbi:MAG: peptide chain release factor N(5)-glutamine methyltransferase [Aeromonas sp.]
MRLDQARAWLREALSPGESPAADSDALLCHLLGRGRSFLHTWPEHVLSAHELATLRAWLARRQAGEPIAHILGVREFWSLPLAVNASTLIPRPDTEVLVELALAKLPAVPCAVLDLGTGTGAIALALKSERADAALWALDVSAEAAALAARNSVALNLPLTVLTGRWFTPLATASAPRFAVIVSNPPYIDAADPHLAQGDVRFEPRSALVADDVGLADLREIIAGAPQFLTTDGWLLLEHGWQQGAAVRDLFAAAGYRQICTEKDFGGNERVTLAQAPA